MSSTVFDDQFTVGTQTIVLHQAYDTVAILRRNVADLEIALRKQTERAESYAETLRSIASYVGAGGYNADTVDAGVFEEKIRWGIGGIMKRAGAAEAELAKLRGQKPVAWCDADGDFYSGESYPNVWPSAVPLYASPVPAPAVHAAPDLIITKIVNVDLWVQVGKVYARCANTREGTGCFAFGDRRFGVTVDTWALMINLDQSAPVFAPAVPATCNDSLQVDIREMLQWLIDQRGKHGHNHKQSGIWDDDNGAMAGKPCEACAMYDKARALLQSAKVTDNAAADRLLEGRE